MRWRMTLMASVLLAPLPYPAAPQAFAETH
jgi:hypothetical protein